MYGAGRHTFCEESFDTTYFDLSAEIEELLAIFICYGYDPDHRESGTGSWLVGMQGWVYGTSLSGLLHLRKD